MIWRKVWNFQNDIKKILLTKFANTEMNFISTHDCSQNLLITIPSFSFFFLQFNRRGNALRVPNWSLFHFWHPSLRYFPGSESPYFLTMKNLLSVMFYGIDSKTFDEPNIWSNIWTCSDASTKFLALFNFGKLDLKFQKKDVLNQFVILSWSGCFYVTILIKISFQFEDGRKKSRQFYQKCYISCKVVVVIEFIFTFWLIRFSISFIKSEWKLGR